MLSTLDRKLLRELIAMRAQGLAIALVIAGGVATFVMSLSVLDSLETTRANYYRDYRFADVFLSLERAPEQLADRVRGIAGVSQVETRVVADVRIEVAGFGDPIRGRLISLPDFGAPVLNDVYLRSGHLPEAGREQQVVVSETFALAHELELGAGITAVINGRRRTLTMVGTVLAPEYIYQIAPGAFIPDFERFAVIWMRRAPLAAAYDMDGAFNDLALTLNREAVVPDVLERLDTMTADSGGLGAYERRDQVSHRFLSEEFKQLAKMSTLFPTIFLAVAAFLLNIVVTRVIGSQREQVAALKAFGYANWQIGWHFLKLITAVTLIGVAIGVAGGIWLGHSMGTMYMQYYKFPYLHYRLEPRIWIGAAAISLAAAFFGTVFAIRRAVGVPPAEAMRPEAPASYRRTLIERFGLGRYLSQPTRMILRQIERQPVKSVLSTLGIAMSGAILIIALFFADSIAFMIDAQFRLAEREDVAVTFTQPTSQAALAELLALPGVEHVEGFRSVPVRFRNGHRQYRGSITGVSSAPELHRALDIHQRPLSIPPAGLLLDEQLAKILKVERGDDVVVEVLEGARPTRHVRIAELYSGFVGIASYMRRSELNRLLREGHAVSGAYLDVDGDREVAVCDALRERPRVVGTTVQRNVRENMETVVSGQMLIFTFFVTILAATIAVGVVYNSARIALDERRRELASLRVLGFTLGEISYILVGEFSILALAAIPLGLILGRFMGSLLLDTMQNDLFRIPFIIQARTYALAASVIVVATALSAYLVQRKLADLDLVEALKAKE